MIKAQLYDEAMAKNKTITSLKLIHLCVDYSTKMEKILVDMKALFTMRNRLLNTSPIPLDKVLDLLKFPDLPPKEVLMAYRRGQH